MPNRLSGSSSPYLLQHAGNPVDWWPWCDEAFDEARRRDVPVFLSIGYATCHWCHVMERESFEDEEVAGVLNADFVCVKVDREERPDVDHQYMAVCQAIGRHCGWPLTVLLTQDRLPFYAATYLPKSARFGRPGVLELAARVRELWTTGREKIEASAIEVAELVRRAEHLPPPRLVPPAVFEQAVAQLADRYDAENGGFGAAPKFPMAHNLVFLLRQGARQGDTRATEMALATLRAMAGSGLNDQLGGGFHRYSTDAEWRLPHFEKMLYDQAWALMAYVEGWQASRDPELRDTALRVAEYVGRDLSSPSGGFLAGEDADSEGEEGLFYVWSADEMDALLGPRDGPVARAYFGVEPAGNFQDEATRLRNGKNVLHPGPDAEARLLKAGIDPANARLAMPVIRTKLLAARDSRVRPARDGKVLCDWNGLTIAAFARAGRAFGEDGLIDRADRAAQFAWERLRSDDGTLFHSYFEDRSSVRGFLDDYAFLAFGLLELGLARSASPWMDRAVELCERMLGLFSSGTGGLWFTDSGAERPLLRQQIFHDGAMPSGNSVALDVLARLARVVPKPIFDEAASRLSASAGQLLAASPGSMAGLLTGLAAAGEDAMEVILVGTPGEATFESLREVAGRSYVPDTLVVERNPASYEWAETPLPAGWRAAAYLCRHRACERPIATSKELRAALERA